MRLIFQILQKEKPDFPDECGNLGEAVSIAMEISSKSPFTKNSPALNAVRA